MYQLKVECGASNRPVSFLLCFSDISNGKRGGSSATVGGDCFQRLYHYAGDKKLTCFSPFELYTSKRGKIDYMACFINR